MNEGQTATVERIFFILSQHCGESGQNEDAVETLERIIRERKQNEVEIMRLKGQRPMAKPGICE